MTPSTAKILTTQQVADRFNELAQEEKWFEIQDELFAEQVKSIEPENAEYLANAEGKAAVRKKGMDWVSKITAGHAVSTTKPVVAGNHFAVGRTFDISTQDFGRIKIEEIMLYQVKDGQIILEQFFY